MFLTNNYGKKMKEIEKLKLEKDLVGLQEDFDERMKDWTKQQFEDRIIIMKENISIKEQLIEENILTKEMFNKNPLLAEAPFEFMKTQEYANMKKQKHLDEFDKAIADNKRIVEMQKAELLYCESKI